MNWDKVKEALHLNKLTSADIPAGAFAVMSTIVILIALKSGKFLTKLVLGLAALALLAGAVWWHLHNR